MAVRNHGEMERAPWKHLDEHLRIETPFVTFFVEELEDETGRTLEWARIEKPDSLLLIIEDGGAILTGPPSFRPGIGAWTLDLPGGRLEGPGGIEGAAARIASRELGLPEDSLEDLIVLTSGGWAIDSSTSSARLHVARARVRDGVSPAENVHRHRSDPEGIEALLGELDCLQCRAALEAWRRGD